LHRDEAEDHIHFRVLLGATDKFGHFVPNQNAALEAMGFERPDPTQPRSRYNNALISFTDALRETFYRECERQGIHIDRNVENYSKRQVTILEYKCEQFRKENQEPEQQLKDKNQDVRDAEQKERDAKIRAQAAQEALDKAVGDRNTLNEQIKALTASQSALEAKNEHLSEENQNLKNENKTLKNQKKELEDRKDELETSIEQLQADKDKAQLEAERAKADRQAALDAAKEIEAAQKRLYQLHDGRSAKTHGTVPAQPAKKNWKGQVIQAARPECTLVETASLQSLEKAAAYHYMVDYAQDQMGQLDKKIAENEIIQSLKQQISDQQTKINELEQQSGKQQLTISNYEYFLEQKGLTAEFEQPAQTQEHTHHFHPLKDG
jgi:chromosome segregation ATPase